MAQAQSKRLMLLLVAVLVALRVALTMALKLIVPRASALWLR